MATSENAAKENRSPDPGQCKRIRFGTWSISGIYRWIAPRQCSPRAARSDRCRVPHRLPTGEVWSEADGYGQIAVRAVDHKMERALRVSIWARHGACTQFLPTIKLRSKSRGGARA
jgi:hypothetical protein